MVIQLRSPSNRRRRDAGLVCRRAAISAVAPIAVSFRESGGLCRFISTTATQMQRILAQRMQNFYELTVTWSSGSPLRSTAAISLLRGLRRRGTSGFEALFPNPHELPPEPSLDTEMPACDSMIKR